MDLNNLLSPSVVRTSGLDKLKVANVYQQNGTSILNGIQDLAKKAGVDISGLARGTGALAQVLPVIQSSASGFDKAMVIQRMVASSGAVGSVLERLPDGVKDTIVSTYKEYGDVVAKVGEFTRKVIGTDITSLRDMSSIINRYTQKDDYATIFDSDASSTFVSGVVREASSQGMPNTYQEMIEPIEDPGTKIKISVTSIDTAVDYSDIEMLASIHTVLGPGMVYQASPGVVANFIAKYQHPQGLTSDQYATQYRRVIEVFTLVDPTWNLFKRLGAKEGETVYNGLVFSGAPESFKALVQAGAYAGTNTDKLYYVASSFPKVVPGSQLASMLAT